MIIRIAIVDDEAQVREKLTGYISRYGSEHPQNELLSDEYRDGVEFLDAYNYQYDLIFMDIEMPFANGMRVAEELRRRDESVTLIFVTNLASYAIEGYSVSAYGFVVKPVNYPEFSTLMTRALEKCRKMNGERFVTITQGYNSRKINTRDILYVSVKGHRIFLHMGSETVDVWGKLSDYEELLEEYDFARCNAYLLINMMHIEYVKNNEVKVGNEILPISQTKKKGFLRRTAEYFAR